MSLLDHVKQILQTEAHRDVLNHDSRKCLNAIQDRMEVYRIVCHLCRVVNYRMLMLRLWLKVWWLHLIRIAHAKDMGWRAL